ncbi:MAG TPA: UPF0149 family protein [Lysobacter sp.]|jgi:uncharacterized protein|uniref:Uncharacterized protein n=1 Tax=Lysobacter concretionis Ko07 = DSM 16239 TaxID=1122185 RepID=A0A0A0EKA9_9GAMM|nr:MULTISPECIES: UPF0149 family protein [Lysobacter]KGM51396.1 hypothetical protein N792_11740 [Lysobacter concretionis Ko07 = DSM 16239]QOD91104.1 UPF0149 family protein [Lysobacter sp. CW239]HUH90089.1 UPF0149 family protein [Lysobacter sp.]
MNTPPAYLDDDQIERLANLLEQRAVPFRGFNLEALDGYLSALAVSPGEVPMAEWEAPVWGKPPRWDDPVERAEVEALLIGHRNMANARVRHGNDDLPDHLAPLLWLPEDPELQDAEAEQEDDLDVGRDWALGFFTAVELREAQWDQWLDENEWMEDIFDLFDRLASGEMVGEDPAEPATPIDYRERLGIIAGLPDMLADLNHYRVDALTPREPIRRDPTPDRNAPCPCGSGKKFKKCCGA